MFRRLAAELYGLLVMGAAVGACGPWPSYDQAIGYSLWPDVHGRILLRDEEGDGTEQFELPSAFGAEYKCGASTIEIVDDGPAGWLDGDPPWVGCDGVEGVHLSLGTEAEAPSVGWPEESGIYRGRFIFGGRSVEIDYGIRIEEDEGELTPLPKDLWVRGLDPATSDYRRRFAISAEVACTQHSLPCSGAWSIELTYDVPRERVGWLYPIAE